MRYFKFSLALFSNRVMGYEDITIVTEGDYPSRKLVVNTAIEKSGRHSDEWQIIFSQEMTKEDYENWCS